MPIEAVIFDCDGTLVDSLLLNTEVLVEYLADLGIALSASDVAARFGDGRLATAIAEFETFLGRRLPGDFVPELRRRRELAVRARLRPIEGAVDLLNALQVPIAVASNGPLRQTRLSLEVTGLVRYFSANVFSAYDVDAWKPDPRLFLHTAGFLGVDPSRCAVVEDGLSGIEAGIAAGMTVFALGRDEQWPSGRVRLVKCLDDVRRSLTGAA
jgi:HAD superfamily hydrolase (TIGR01509 family)